MTATVRTRLAGVSLLLVLLYLLSAVLTASPVAAASVEPILTPGNPSCADVTNGGVELKIEKGGELQAGDSGTYTDGVLEVSLTIYRTDSGWEFDWSSNHGVDSVVAKGGPTANVYMYSPIATSDAGLHSPLNPNNGQWYGLSHISFCYLEENTTTSTTSGSSTSSSSTSSSSTSSSSTSSTSSTSSSTTSSTEGTTPRSETSTTVSVQGTVVTTAPPEGAVPTVAGTVVTTAAVIAVDTLPFTGAEAQDMTVLAIGVLLTGALLLSSVRRTEPAPGRHVRRWSDHQDN